ncbi:MAG: gluconate 2-dehydrogenase subunit 3 family protein [Spirosomataceae bacterium]
MNRREAIQRVTLMLGGVMSAPLMAGAMGEVLYTGESVAVAADQEALITELADVIIPTTSTPGAKAAGVQKFIIRVMRDCYVKADQDKFYNGLAKFEEGCKFAYGKNFVELSADEKKDAVKKMTVADKDTFLRLKELTITGYFTSEIGATQALAYLPIPGRFDACIPLEPGQKTWAL